MVGQAHQVTSATLRNGETVHVNGTLSYSIRAERQITSIYLLHGQNEMVSLPSGHV
jgi:hypothetical protein